MKLVLTTLLFSTMFVFQSFAQNKIHSNQITLTFSEPMDSAGFRDFENFIVFSEKGDTLQVVSGGIDHTKQPMQGFTEFIIMVEPAMLFGVKYQVEVWNVSDLAGNLIAAGKNFVFFVTPYRNSKY